jgi:hypothetical protein
MHIRAVVWTLLLGLAGCASPSERELSRELSRIVAEDGVLEQEWHRGPAVHVDSSGPARFVEPLHGAFDGERAMRTVRFADTYYRAPANPGYDAVLEHIAKELRASGFDGQDERLELDFLTANPQYRAWTPKSAEITLSAPGREPVVLHAFHESAAPERVMLPEHAPACAVEGPVVLHLEDVVEGSILATAAPLSQVAGRAEARGAAGVVSASLAPFNVDPSGAERHLDAIQFRTLPADTTLPGMQISPRSLEAIRAAHEAAHAAGGEARLALRAEVEFEDRPLRTLVATVVGARRPQEAIVLVSHVQEPGACDNASGVGGLCESVRSLVSLLRAGRLAWPGRSLVFLWGDEFRQSESWLQVSDKTPIAGLSSDMTGESKETGAIALLERMPDPGAITTLPPDQHTPWGAGAVDPESLTPNGLAVIARCALVDVGLLEGGWPCADHPWEGGSDHDVFIRRGVPAVLFWHFTDFTYHTSLDRLAFVDPDEMRRTGVALLATALALASPEPGDLERYLKSLRSEEEVRVAAAADAGSPETAERWRSWCLGAREWLRNQCLGSAEPIPPSEPNGHRP